MLYIHPVLQFFSLLAAIYALILGINRFRILHMHHKTVFKWKRHVIIGTASLSLWIVGAFSAMSLVYFYWHGFLITGLHAKVALVMLPMILFGLISGHYMNYNKKKRKIIPLIHGINNLILIILALMQIKSGLVVYNTFILGN
jgi:hypothetical protein